MKQTAYIALLNARLEEGAFTFADGFRLQRWNKEPLKQPRLQGYPTPLADHAALVYERNGDGLLCFDRAFLSSARLLLALIELRCQCRLWFPSVLGEAEQTDAGAGSFFLSSQTVLPSYGDLDNHPDPEISLYLDDLESVVLARRALAAQDTTARTAIIGVRRWASCRERLDDQDAILDAWIGLESIYLRRREPKRELVSKRISRYVTEDLSGTQRSVTAYGLLIRKAYDWAFEAYGIRSDVIHGDFVDPTAAREARWHSEALLQATLRPLVFGGELAGFDPKRLAKPGQRNR